MNPGIVTCGQRAIWRRIALLALAGIVAGGRTSGAQPLAALGLRVSQQARALQPGEVVRLAVKATQPLASLEGSLAGLQVPFWRAGPEEWEGFVGLDVELVPGEHRLMLYGVAGDGTPIAGEHLLAVAPKAFRERQLKVDPRFSDPPASAMPRIQREARVLEEIFSNASCGQPPARVFGLPSADPASSPFGSRSFFNGKPRSRHNGVDFASARGAPIVAPADGRVVLVDDFYFTGTTVVLQHGCGLYSLFAHLDHAHVVSGAAVQRGARLGAVGSTGRSTGPHLHWSVRLHGAKVDPLALVAIAQPER